MQQFENILLFKHGDDNSHDLERAKEIALVNAAPLTIFDVVSEIPRYLRLFSDAVQPDRLQELVVEERIETLSQLLTPERDEIDVSVEVAVGKPPQKLIQKVVDDNCDLVIKSAEDPGFSDRLFGTLDMHLMRECPCPVWVLKPCPHVRYRKIVAAIDPAAHDKEHLDLNRSIVETAYSFATRERAECHIVAAWEVWMEPLLRNHGSRYDVDLLRERRQREAKEAIDKVLCSVGVDLKRVKVHCANAEASQCILSAIKQFDADLLVIGTVCRTGIPGTLIGNTAERVLTNATCSVLSLKPEAFKSTIHQSA